MGWRLKPDYLGRILSIYLLAKVEGKDHCFVAGAGLQPPALRFTLRLSHRENTRYISFNGNLSTQERPDTKMIMIVHMTLRTLSISLRNRATKRQETARSLFKKVTIKTFI